MEELLGKKVMDQYMSLYSQDFSARGINRDEWRTYKTRLARKYKRIEIKVRNLMLFQANGLVLARFDQEYHTDLFQSSGEKLLYFAKKGNGYRIIGEIFEPHKIAKASPVHRPAVTGEILDFIDAWKNAWEKKDLDTYIAAYDRGFHSEGMNLQAWRKYKAELNKKYASLKIDIKRVRILSSSNDSAHIRFFQDYQADKYSDSGIKDLMLVKRRGKWKIKTETWRPKQGPGM